MGVSWYWYEGYERIAVIEYMSTWTMLDNDIILNAIVKQIKKRGYQKIDFISYLADDAVMPAEAERRGEADRARTQPYTNLVVFVGLRGAAREVYLGAQNSVQTASSYQYQLADTIQQAVQIIVANRKFQSVKPV